MKAKGRHDQLAPSESFSILLCRTRGMCNVFLCFFAFHGSIVFIVIVIGIAHILIVYAEVEARIIVEYAFGLAFFVFSAVVAMTFVYLSVDFHGSILCVIG